MCRQADRQTDERPANANTYSITTLHTGWLSGLLTEDISSLWTAAEVGLPIQIWIVDLVKAPCPVVFRLAHTTQSYESQLGLFIIFISTLL